MLSVLLTALPLLSTREDLEGHALSESGLLIILLYHPAKQKKQDQSPVRQQCAGFDLLHARKDGILLRTGLKLYEAENQHTKTKKM